MIPGAGLVRGKVDHPAREIIYVTESISFQRVFGGSRNSACRYASGYWQTIAEGYLGGIPMHRFAIDTAAHSEVGIKVDGRIDEPVWVPDTLLRQYDCRCSRYWRAAEYETGFV